MFQNSETVSPDDATAEIQEHLAQCASCRSDLALMQGARNELRTFPVVQAPVDLRSRIQHQLQHPEAVTKAEVAAAAVSENGSSPSADGIGDSSGNSLGRDESRIRFVMPPYSDLMLKPATPVVAWDSQEADAPPLEVRISRFLRHPTNITWISCVAVFVLSIVTMALPGGNYLSDVDLEGAPIIIESVQDVRRGGNEAADSTLETAEKTSRSAIPKPNQPPAAPASKGKPPALPPVVASNKPFPFAAPGLEPGAPADAGNPQQVKESAAVAGASGNVGGNAQRSADGNSGTSKPKSAPSPGAATSAPPKPSASASNAQAGRRDANSAMTDTSASQSASTVRQRLSESESGSASERRSLSAAGDSNEAELREPTAAAAPSAAMRSQESRDTAPRKAAQVTSQAAKNTTVEVSTRITPPRNMGWAQVSVNLPDGVRFADGTSSRVLWRGAAQSNEPVELNFDVVVAAPGRHQIKVSLQEVKDGEAQTVAFKPVAVNGN